MTLFSWIQPNLFLRVFCLYPQVLPQLLRSSRNLPALQLYPFFLNPSLSRIFRQDIGAANAVWIFGSTKKRQYFVFSKWNEPRYWLYVMKSDHTSLLINLFEEVGSVGWFFCLPFLALSVLQWVNLEIGWVGDFARWLALTACQAKDVISIGSVVLKSLVVVHHCWAHTNCGSKT